MHLCVILAGDVNPRRIDIEMEQAFLVKRINSFQQAESDTLDNVSRETGLEFADAGSWMLQHQYQFGLIRIQRYFVKEEIFETGQPPLIHYSPFIEVHVAGKLVQPHVSMSSRIHLDLHLLTRVNHRSLNPT